MQSWGVHSRFSVRDSGLEPSKSGVLGLVCAALGVDRADDEGLARLAALKMAVRVDREGALKVDYQTALNVLKAGGGIKKTEPSNRYYLAGALFVVGLAGEDLALLEQIHQALRSPRWPLFLGRKAFVPGEPVWLPDGLKPGLDLLEALDSRVSPDLGSRPGTQKLRLVYEDPAGVIVRADQPLSFASRRFAPRRVTSTFISLPAQQPEAP